MPMNVLSLAPIQAARKYVGGNNNMAKKSNTGGLLKGRWTIWALSLFFSLAAGYGVLTLIGSAAEQVPYYVMSEDVPARTPIMPEVVTETFANADGVPPNAITKSQLESKQWYSKVPLKQGDVLSSSVLTDLTRITQGLPEDFVAVSVAVPPENAAAGQIGRGDYIDIAAIYENQGNRLSKVVLHNVLVLDVSVAPETIASAANKGTTAGDLGPDSAAMKTGVPQLYTLAVSPEDFATLNLIRNNDIYLALSQGLGSESVNASITEDQIFTPGEVGTSGTGTEETIANQEAGAPSAAPSAVPSAVPSGPAASSSPSTATPTQ